MPILIRKWLRKVRQVKPDSAWLASTRQNLIAYQNNNPSVWSEKSTTASWQFSLVWLKTTPVVASLVVLVFVGSTALAAQASLPDQFLYPVKIATEQVRLSLSVTSLGKTKVQLNLADRRLGEVQKLIQLKKSDQLVENTLQEYTKNIEQVSVVLSGNNESNNNYSEITSDFRIKLVDNQKVLTQLSFKKPESNEDNKLDDGGVVTLTMPVVSNSIKISQLNILKALQQTAEAENKITLNLSGKNIALKSAPAKANKIELGLPLPAPIELRTVDDSGKVNSQQWIAYEKMLEQKSEPNNTGIKLEFNDDKKPEDGDGSSASQSITAPSAISIVKWQASIKEVDDKLDLVRTKIKSFNLETSTTEDNALRRVTELLVEAQNLINKAEQKKSEMEFKRGNDFSEAYQAALQAYQAVLQAEVGSLEASGR